MKKLWFLFLLLLPINFIWANEPVIRSLNNDKTMSIEGSDIPNIYCRVCDAMCLLYEDIDSDGYIEGLWIYEPATGLGLSFQKLDKKGTPLFWDNAEFEFENSETYQPDVDVIFHDFDGDNIPEIVIGYLDNGICGRVYKLNGKGLDLQKLHDVLENTNLKLSNFIQQVGYVSGGWDNCYIDRSSIHIQVSPIGQGWTEYLFHNGQLRRLD